MAIQPQNCCCLWLNNSFIFLSLKKNVWEKSRIYNTSLMKSFLFLVELEARHLKTLLNQLHNFLVGIYNAELVGISADQSTVVLGWGWGVYVAERHNCLIFEIDLSKLFLFTFYLPLSYQTLYQTIDPSWDLSKCINQTDNQAPCEMKISFIVLCRRQ